MEHRPSVGQRECDNIILQAENKNGFYIIQNPNSEIILETLKGEDILSYHRDYDHASANQLYDT